MRQILRIGLGMTFVFALLASAAKGDVSVEQGETIFQGNCASCHKLGGKLVGPNLYGVQKRWDGREELLIKFIQNSQKVIQSGDEYSQKLYQEYNQMVMPPMNLSNEEVKSVLAYIESEKKAEAAPAKTEAAQGGGGAAPAMGPFDDPLMRNLVIAIVVLFFAMIMLTSNLLSKANRLVQGKRDIKPMLHRLNARLMPVFLVVMFAAIIYEIAIHSKYLLPEAASEHGKEIDLLQNITLVITGVVFVFTQIMLFVFAYRFRSVKGRIARYIPVNDKLEVIWTLIPAVVLAALVLYGFKAWKGITYPTDKEMTHVEVFAYQFNWKVRYPGPDGELGDYDYRLISAENPLGLDLSDPAAKDDIIKNKIVMAKDQLIKFHFRSRDVLHAAHMPHFRAQMYCVPGMPTEFKLTPTMTTEEMRAETGNEDFEYEMACNQICGSAHFNMRAVIEVKEQSEVTAWLDKQTPFYETLSPEQVAELTSP
jgi:cytochrome c oxidase subunit 2